MKTPVTSKKTKQTTGITIASIVVTIDPRNSNDATIKFPNPPVVPDEIALIETVPVCTSPATPPPAINANDHFSNGDISA